MFAKQNNFKIKPAFFHELEKCSNTNLIFIATDWPSVNMIRRSKGICLLCDKNSDYYDFGFCVNCEVWIMYSQDALLSHAMQLGHSIQLFGANKVVIIRTNPIIKR